MKVAVIGGGSTYTPDLVNGFLSGMEKFPLKELWLMDIDPDRLEIVGGFAKRMVNVRGDPFEVVLSTDQQECVSGASYVATQLRVGQMEGRRRDEYSAEPPCRQWRRLLQAAERPARTFCISECLWTMRPGCGSG